MEARSSGDLSLARSISIIESSGFRCNGVNPVAKLEVLTKPSETHLSKRPGMVSSCCWRVWRVELTDRVAKVRCCTEVEERIESDKVLESLDDMRCIVFKLIKEDQVQLSTIKR